MNNLTLLLAFLFPVFSYCQVVDNFTDGDFSHQPTWTGISSNFVVNSSFQLQSKASATSVSYLTTPSKSIENAMWECAVKIAYTTSSSNYSAIYLISDSLNIAASCNAYYVQIGGTNDEVSLFLQQGTKKTKIIDGADKRTDGNTVDMRIKVTRDSLGNFSLYSKLASESDYVLEGQVNNMEVLRSEYFGLLYSNTSTTGSAYSFDDIHVVGSELIDRVAPVCTSIEISALNQLTLTFSEPIVYNSATILINSELVEFVQYRLSEDLKTLRLTLPSDFQAGRWYHFTMRGIKDVTGNVMEDIHKELGQVEKPKQNDVLLNEIMFESPENSVEYIELYNHSDKLLDVSNLVFTTRKSDLTLNKGNTIAPNTWMLPHSYLVLCENVDSLRNYFSISTESPIIKTGWSTLNNESATLVLLNATRDTILDEVNYHTKWHHVMVKNPKGVALERINPDLPSQDSKSWHSAASEVNFGTPGYQNSQFRSLDSTSATKMVWIEPEIFTPDNDGVDDICFIRYKTELNGYVANVMIINSIGNRVVQLASNLLLSSQGFLTWDGKTSEGKNASVGIYVLYIEMFNPQSGDKKQYKLPIVVSTR
jgi:hypothetical protein